MQMNVDRFSSRCGQESNCHAKVAILYCRIIKSFPFHHSGEY
jgi:hypothetical protein